MGDEKISNRIVQDNCESIQSVFVGSRVSIFGSNFISLFVLMVHP